MHTAKSARNDGSGGRLIEVQLLLDPSFLLQHHEQPSNHSWYRSALLWKLLINCPMIFVETAVLQLHPHPHPPRTPACRLRSNQRGPNSPDQQPLIPPKSAGELKRSLHYKVGKLNLSFFICLGGSGQILLSAADKKTKSENRSVFNKRKLFEHALQSGGIWKRWLCVLVWMESI